jgi:2-succinyl-5-enolpyruvyl-6-hydroxy-3-cyclohexene-1-carboxylate synthase
MKREEPHINQLWASLAIEELARNAVTTFCLSPGSRSTPLAVAVARHDRAKVFAHFDERGAAFHALGIAKATGVPVALICTSGTAVANYLPAIIEASQAQVPLIVLTADRPPELQDVGANQVIDQSKIFGGYVRWYHSLPCPESAVDPSIVLTTMDQAVYRAWSNPSGPVHINCMFREPFGVTPKGQTWDGLPDTLSTWRQSTNPETPHTAYAMPKLIMDTAQQRRLMVQINNSARGLLIVGQLRDSMEAASVSAFAEALKWPALPDITSGLRLGSAQGPWIPYYDQLLLSQRFRSFCQPDFVLHIGGSCVSKRLTEHFEANPPRHYVRVVAHGFRYDPAHNVTQRIEADVPRFCSALTEQLHPKATDESWGISFRAFSKGATQTTEEKLDHADDLDEAVVARVVSKKVKRGTLLFVGNSMPIRDMDMYGAIAGPHVRIVANRGASGIDGTIATATGLANGSHSPVVAVVGDVAALHDLNSFALMSKAAAPVVAVIINNDGGGIFNFLPIAQFDDVFEPYFATPHGLHFAGAAQLFDLNYHVPKTPQELADVLEEAQTLGRSAIIEVQIKRTHNVSAHQSLQHAIVAAIDAV